MLAKTDSNDLNGSVTFSLYGPDDASCSTAIFTSDAVTVSGDGTYDTPAGFTTTAAGTYQWVASYTSNDDSNANAMTACGDEPVVISLPEIITPSITTTVGAGTGTTSDTFHDTATLTGSASATGTISILLFTALATPPASRPRNARRRCLRQR